MGHPTMVNGSITKSVALEPTNGLMAEFMLETGRTITCMVRENIHGLTVEGTRALTLMIKSTDSEHTLGPMDVSTQVTGKMESSMDREFTSTLMVTLEPEFGLKESAPCGLMMQLSLKQQKHPRDFLLVAKNFSYHT